MGWRSVDYLCPSGHLHNFVVATEDRHLPRACDVCGVEAAAQFGVPRPLRASYPDGTRRPGLRNQIEASNLEAQSFDLPPVERGELQREVTKLRSADTK